MDIVAQLTGIVGAEHIFTGTDTAGYATDWTGKYTSSPIAVVRPATTAQVSQVVKLAAATKTPIVPIGGNTGLTGATLADGAVLLSLERLNKIREIRPKSRIAIVDAGVILSNLHSTVEPHGLSFPLTFGARGTATIGGNLATNAGGSNVVRYGNTRALCLGLEVVLPSGEIMDLMSELHKDNAGYDLRDLIIGAEGTLGIITSAVVKLFPKPSAYATAMVALPKLSSALDLLNQLQTMTGGAVEAFEFMPASYMALHAQLFPNARAAFDTIYPVNILVEVGATAPRDVAPDENGDIPIATLLESVLAAQMEDGDILDAVVAQNDTQRRDMWERREQAADLAFHKKPFINSDVSVPLEMVEVFLEQADARLKALDPTVASLCVSHLGDGNIHLTVWPSDASPEHEDRVVEIIEDVVFELRGSFSAEHGIGTSKLSSMQRRKDPAALATMRAIKSALDPHNIMNPGKVLP